MKIAEGIQFIKHAISKSENTELWADLGCGNGLFTLALAELLPKGSTIYAVDNISQKLPSLTENGITIHFLKSDIENSTLDLPPLDGIIMANSLHYVKNQMLTIQKLEALFKYVKKFILIEYDSSISNQWVPYPIPFSILKNLFPSDKYHISKIAERTSIYGQGNMYCALITSKTINYDS